MRTHLELEGADAWFVLGGLDDAEQAAARDLRYAERDGAFVKRFPAADAERVYPRFAACAAELLAQTARRIPAPWEDALGLVLEGAPGVDWWLTGSAALAVRGIAVAPRDVDLVTTAAGAEALAQLLADVLVEPLTVGDGWIATHFARAFSGARLEWVGGVAASVDDGGNSDFGPAAASRLEVVAWRGRDVRVPPLELQLRNARTRGLDDRVRAIEAGPA